MGPNHHRAPEPTRVTVGNETHGDVHVAYAKDQLGRRLDTVSIPRSTGYQDLLVWAQGLGQVAALCVEVTGSYGRPGPVPAQPGPGRA